MDFCVLTNAGDRAFRAKVRECALALATSGKCDPATVDARGRTHLYYACKVGLHEAVSYWIRQDSSKAAFVMYNASPPDGHCTAFAACCIQACEFKYAKEMQEGAKVCAAFLAQLPACDPCNTGSLSMPYLTWACYAGFTDIVTHWLTDARVQGLLKDEKGTGTGSIFASACRLSERRIDPPSPAPAGENEDEDGREEGTHEGSVDQEQPASQDSQWSTQATTYVPDTRLQDLQANIRASVTLLGKSPLVGPACRDHKGRTYLHMACIAGLPGVVQHWLEHDKDAVFTVLRDESAADGGKTAVDLALSAAVSPTKPWPVRHGCAECAKLLQPLSVKGAEVQ